LSAIIHIGGFAALIGVALNLILGLSRVALAMARRGDLPAVFARINSRGDSPTWAVVLVSVLVMGLVIVGDLKLAWSFSAFTVLIYYAITNLAALRLPREQRLYPRALSWAGLVVCLGLAWFVEARVWMVGCGVIAMGLMWRFVFRALARKSEVASG
jgi:basic amino acid/polyamine antiporter, APA family